MLMICGIDEAGRGPALGPLVVGAVFASDVSKLEEIGVKDSKKLTAKKREKLYDEIISIADHWTVEIISAEGIDEERKMKSLNQIELEMFCKASSSFKTDTIIADCPDINEESFTARMSESLGKSVKIIAKHKADDTYPIVSAASIIAKVTRDRMIAEIQKEFGVNIGSGYPSDHYTMDFIREWIERNGVAPPHVRTSWEPVRNLLSQRKIRKIDDW